jgi:hypothetical protein
VIRFFDHGATSLIRMAAIAMGLSIGAVLSPGAAFSESNAYCRSVRSVIGPMTETRSNEFRRDLINYLQNGGRINGYRDKIVRSTYLHDASFAGDLENIRYLLRRGATINARDKNGGTPIFYAVSGCQLNAAALLMANGADPNLVERAMGLSAIGLAKESKQNRMLRVLLKK